jgi:hypothetical protein
VLVCNNNTSQGTQNSSAVIKNPDYGLSDTNSHYLCLYQSMLLCRQSGYMEQLLGLIKPEKKWSWGIDEPVFVISLLLSMTCEISNKSIK